MAYIVLNKDKVENTQKFLEDIENTCKKSLPEYYVEGCKYRIIDALPLTAIGKVDFRTLQKMADENRR